MRCPLRGFYVELAYYLCSLPLVIDGNIIVDSGESLHINTSTPDAHLIRLDKRISLNITTVKQTPLTGPGVSTWPYSVVYLVIEGSLTLMENSSVRLSGPNALSIKSLNGDITVRTDIELTCSRTILNGMCLGGFMPAKVHDPMVDDIVVGRPC